jgi:TonB family protein
MTGRIVGGRYRLERELERCGMGTLYLASDREADAAPFAVKIFRPVLRSISEAMTLLRAEVRVARMLRHPHIARTYALHADNVDTYLVSEYPGGQSLEALLQRTRQGLALDDAVVVVDDLCAALAYAHDMDVVHGDVQPATVYVTPTGSAKLIDFGMIRVARVCNERVDALWTAGRTLAYASVDMLEGREPDVRDDVYSLACLMYTVLSGVHPFGSHSAVEARRRGLEMPSLVALSRDQNAALARALAFERAQRTPSVIALLGDLGWTPDFAAPPKSLAPVAAAFVPDGGHVVTQPIRAVAAPPAVDAPSMAPGRGEPLRASRWARFRIPLFIGSLLVAVGVALAVVLVYRGSAPSATNSSPLPDPEPPPSRAGDAPPPVVPDTAAATPPPLASPTLAPPAPAPPAPPPSPSPAPPVLAPAAVALLKPLPQSAAAMAQNENCPYPREAVDQGLTGTVSLSVFVTADGKAEKARTEKTSGFPLLDEAAVRCVEQFGRFPRPSGGPHSGGYWAHMRFKWSFGG